MTTHEVINQPPPLIDYNPFTADRTLQAALHRQGGAWAHDDLTSFGAVVGSAEVIEWGFLANTNPPQLVTHDPFGHRIDRVEYHPAWHSLMNLSVSQGLHSMPWEGNQGGGYAARAAGFPSKTSSRASGWTAVSLCDGWKAMPRLSSIPLTAAPSSGPATGIA